MSHDSADAYDTLVQFLYQAPIGLVQTTLEGEIVMINPMSAQLLMPLVPNGDLLNLFDALQEVAPSLRALAAGACEPGTVICDGLLLEHATSDARGARSTRILSLRLLRLDRASLVACVADATAQVRHEREQLAVRLHDAARTDVLTALPNRAAAMERIGQALERTRADPAFRFAVLLVDCDRFDRINTVWGTHVGDALLRGMGERLNGVVRHTDRLDPTSIDTASAARLGSDQFVLVLHDLRDADDVRHIAQRVVETLGKPWAIEGNQVHLTASVGALFGPGGGNDPEEVLQNAHIAMHEAKRAGGARCDLYAPCMKEKAARLATVENDLRSALVQDELFVVYQPIISMTTDRCIAMEALVRWRHPERGIVPPVEFIGVAEATGLIGALGEFVLMQSCLQLQAWRSRMGERAPEKICVNVSRAQLLGGEFVEQVANALTASGLEAARLQLEITESLAAQDEAVIAQLHGLKQLGVSLALDDFGTGYSSLSSLHQLPVDVVKIDRSFVSQIETSAHHRVLIEATVMVAESLRMSTVAEGVETAGQFEMLRRMGCHKVQGYLISKPMAPEAAQLWLHERCARPTESSSSCAQAETRLTMMR